MFLNNENSILHFGENGKKEKLCIKVKEKYVLLLLMNTDIFKKRRTEKNRIN